MKEPKRYFHRSYSSLGLFFVLIGSSEWLLVKIKAVFRLPSCMVSAVICTVLSELNFGLYHIPSNWTCNSEKCFKIYIFCLHSAAQ